MKQHRSALEVECCLCHHSVSPEEELLCSVCGRGSRYHKECAKEAGGVSNLKKFKCPQHVCFICKQKLHLRCVRCPAAFHTKCAPWPEAVIPLKDHPGKAVCWRHHFDWCLDKKGGGAARESTKVLNGSIKGGGIGVGDGGTCRGGGDLGTIDEAVDNDKLEWLSRIISNKGHYSGSMFLSEI
ncbi:[histone H3]-lysine(4) N-trimethyltransferase [Trifolium repens]|nr:[histone H3]-lysine(4) N-trimethyltransferase [Trifolium repens]